MSACYVIEPQTWLDGSYLSSLDMHVPSSPSWTRSAGSPQVRIERPYTVLILVGPDQEGRLNRLADDRPKTQSQVLMWRGHHRMLVEVGDDTDLSIFCATKVCKRAAKVNPA